MSLDHRRPAAHCDILTTDARKSVAGAGADR